MDGWRTRRVGTWVRRRELPWLVAVGVAGGLLGVAFVGAIGLVERLLAPGAHEPVGQVAILAGTGLMVGVATHRWGTTGGVDVLVDNIHVLGGTRERRGLRTAVPSAVLGIAAGGALGPEAPLVESAGAAGTAVADRLGWSPSSVRVLTLTGMAAGFSVLFGAPIGGAVFALEILHRDGLEYYEALVPTLVGSLSGLVVFDVATGHGLFRPLWAFPDAVPAGLADLGPVVVVAAVGAAAAVAFVVGVRGVRSLAGRLPRWVRPAAGGVALGLLAWWSPFALTFGEGQLQDLVATQPTVGVLLVAAAAKLLASAACAGTGWKGGFIIPLFFVGGALGQALHAALPGTDLALLMTCGMVAACVGATKTPLGATLVVAGMTGFGTTPMLLVAALVSLALTRPLVHFRSQRPRSAGTPTVDDPPDELGAAA